MLRYMTFKATTNRQPLYKCNTPAFQTTQPMISTVYTPASPQSCGPAKRTFSSAVQTTVVLPAGLVLSVVFVPPANAHNAAPSLAFRSPPSPRPRLFRGALLQGPPLSPYRLRTPVSMLLYYESNSPFDGVDFRVLPCPSCPSRETLAGPLPLRP